MTGFSNFTGLSGNIGLWNGNSGLWGGATGLIEGGGASLYLNFLAGAPLDPRVTFSRGSNATLVDSTGKITYAPANLFLQSQTFDDGYWQQLGSTVTANAAVAPDGTTTAEKLIETATTAQHYITRITAFPAGTTYALSFYAKAAERQWIAVGFNNDGFRVAWFNLATGVVGTVETSVISASMQPVGNGWYRCVIISATTAGSPYPSLMVANANGVKSYTGDGTSGVFIWGAQLEPLTYQTTPSTYNATTSAAYYGPRFDYDPVTLAARGLLIEEQRVNIMLQSQALETTWTRGNILAFGSGSVVNAIAAPDGTTSAEFIVPDTTGGVAHFMAQSVSHTAASYTISAYVKAGAYTKFAFRENTTLGTYATFNVSTGTVIETNGTATIQNAGNGWYRCTLTYTGAAVSQAMGLYVLPAAYTSGSPHLYLWAGDGTSGLYMWGVQDELGSFATSYIPTVASQVTRSLDVATMTGTNFSSWYNQTEGTFVISGSRFVTTATAGFTAFASANNGTNTNEIYITQALDTGTVAARAFIRSTAGAPGDMIGPAWPLNTVGNAAVAYQLNNAGISYNGSAVVADTDVGIPTVNRLSMGARGNGLDPLNGHIRQIAYYNTRLPNATLQALTA
jgi:hypothetical protein